MSQLTIVVPYRAREAHFQQFVPHLKAFFSRDKAHRAIPYRVLVIEQEEGLPFNAGALRNIGYALAQDDGSDFSNGYTCFHDIDYLPLSADYGWSTVPAQIAWYGAEWRPVAVGSSLRHVYNDPYSFFGAVVLAPNSLIAKVNGYSNRYWGWGWQDLDFRTRFVAAGFGPVKRLGTFLPLDHDNRGFTLDGKLTPIGLVNRRLFDRKWAGGGQSEDDGLSSLKYEILQRRDIDRYVHNERPTRWEIVKVRLNLPSSPEHDEALDPGAEVRRFPMFSWGPTGMAQRSADRGPVVPLKVRVEASSFCQLRCPSCPTTSRAIDPAVGRGFLSFENFRRLLDRNPQVMRVELSNYGEAFLNPHLVQMLEYANARGVAVEIANGANLNNAKEVVLEALVKFSVRAIACSIDGASAESYARYRVGGDFGTVLANVRTINRFKKKYKSEYPRLTWQFIVFGHNEHEIPVARSLAHDLNMDFVVKLSWDPDLSPIRDPAFVRAESGLAAVTREEHARLHGEDFLSGICHQLWDEPQVNWDGKILGCCRNFWGDFGGNAFADGLVVAINGERLGYARAMLQGKAAPRNDIPCTSCEMYISMRKRSHFLTRTA
jgi:N-terminal region of glycosyl transferase group 7/N-terminal domain of galactosyltransferase